MIGPLLPGMTPSFGLGSCSSQGILSDPTSLSRNVPLDITSFHRQLIGWATLIFAKT